MKADKMVILYGDTHVQWDNRAPIMGYASNNLVYPHNIEFHSTKTGHRKLFQKLSKVI